MYRSVRDGSLRYWIPRGVQQQFVIYTAAGFSINNIKKQCLGSGSGLNPGSIRSEDPEPDPEGQK